MLAVNVPAQLRERRRWLTWAYGPPRPNGRCPKVPHVARTGRHASVVNPADWCDFEVALEALAKAPTLAGLGYVFAAGDKMAGVDFDNCRSPETGELAVATAQLLADLNTYTEVLPSETGVKAFAAGELDPNGAKRRFGVEIYGTGRFFTVTGQHVPGTPLEVRPAGGVLRRLQAALNPALRPQSEWIGIGFEGTDAELLQRAWTAKNGAKVKAYFAGNLCGKPSHSEALLGLAQLLAFWTGRDLDRLERLGCSSQLYLRAEAERLKWHSRRGSHPWGIQYVVLKAIETCREFHSGLPSISPLTTQKTQPCVTLQRGFGECL
jgi:putative DNA primase/helicase